jgi:hypothetical protein
MLKFSPRFLGAALGFALAAVDAAELRLPPFTGELNGVVTRFALPGAPALQWRVAAAAGRDGRIDYTIATDADGVHVRGTAHLAANGDGTWQIDESVVEVGPWLAVLAPWLGSGWNGVTADGKLKLTGGGELRRGKPRGKVKVELDDAIVRKADQGWSLAGVSLHGEFSFETDGLHWASVGPVEVAVRTITTARFGARNLKLNASVDDKLVVALESARLEAGGGELWIDPSKVPLSPPSIKVRMHMQRVGLQDIVALVPGGLADARGRIDGELGLGWSPKDGLELGAGRLGLRDDEPAIVHLEPSPGFLTKRVPERIALLPASAGALARWLSPLNPAYADLSAIELGRTALRVQSLTVEVTPEGDARGRSASIRVVAKPVQEHSSVGVVTFDVNVAGPLSAVLRLGMQDGVSMNVH